MQPDIWGLAAGYERQGFWLCSSIERTWLVSQLLIKSVEGEALSPIEVSCLYGFQVGSVFLFPDGATCWVSGPCTESLLLLCRKFPPSSSHQRSETGFLHVPCFLGNQCCCVPHQITTYQLYFVYMLYYPHLLCTCQFQAFNLYLVNVGAVFDIIWD